METRGSLNLWSFRGMMFSMIKLTREQTEAASQSPLGVPCQGDGTAKLFVIVDAEVHQKMKDVAYRKDVLASVAAGNADIEAGRCLRVEDADTLMREKMKFPPPSDS